MIERLPAAKNLGISGYFGGRSSPSSHAAIDGSSSGSIRSHSRHRNAPGPLPSGGITSTIKPPQRSHRPDGLDCPMLQFGAGLAATSNPFCVNSEGFLSRNREMPGDMQGLKGRGK